MAGLAGRGVVLLLGLIAAPVLAGTSFDLLL